MTTFWLQLRLLATILTLVAFVVAASDSPGECMDSSNNTIPDNADYQSSNHLPLIVVTNGSANEGYWSVFYLLSTGRVRVRSTVRNRKFVSHITYHVCSFVTRTSHSFTTCTTYQYHLQFNPQMHRS